MHLTLVNDGNKPAVIVSVELFMLDNPRTWTPNEVKNNDCDRTDRPDWKPFHLYEKDAQSSNVRGDDTEVSYENRVIPAINLPSYRIADIKHRFSLSNQLSLYPSSLEGMLCLDVAAMTVSGRVFHAPQPLGLLSAWRGHMLDRTTTKTIGDNKFDRFNGTKISARNTSPIYPIIPHNQPAPQAPTKTQFRNWVWFLQEDERLGKLAPSYATGCITVLS